MKNKIMEYIIQMHLLGVHNQKTIKDSFKSIFILNFLRSNGGDAFKHVVATGILSKRMLKMLCISELDLSFPLNTVSEKVEEKFKYMDAEDRATTLNKVILEKYSPALDKMPLKQRFKIWLFFKLYNWEISIT